MILNLFSLPFTPFLHVYIIIQSNEGISRHHIFGFRCALKPFLIGILSARATNAKPSRIISAKELPGKGFRTKC